MYFGEKLVSLYDDIFMIITNYTDNKTKLSYFV